MEEENVRKVYKNIFERYIVKREYTTVNGLNKIIENEKIADSRYLKVCSVLKKFVELRNEILNNPKNIDIFNIEIEEYKPSYINVEAPNDFTGDSDNNPTRNVYDFVKTDAFDEVPFDYNITYTDSKKESYSNYSSQPITSIHGCEFAVMCEKILPFIKKSLETYRTEIESIYGFDYEKSKIVEYKGFFSNSCYSVKERIDTCFALNGYTSRSMENLNEYYKSCFDGVSVIFDSILKLEKHVKNDITEEETKKLESNELFLKTIGILEDQLKGQFEDKLKEKDKLIEESQRKLKEKELEIEDLKNQIEQQKKENEKLKNQLDQKAKELSLLMEQLNKSRQQFNISENSNSFEMPYENKKLNIESTNLLEMIPNELKSKIEQVENFSIDPEVQKDDIKQQNTLEISDLLIFNQQTIGEDMTDSNKTNYEEVAQKIVAVVNYFNSKNGNDKKYNTIKEILELGDSDFRTLQEGLLRNGNDSSLISERNAFLFKIKSLKNHYNEKKDLLDIFKSLKKPSTTGDESTKETYFETNEDDNSNFESFYKKLLGLSDFTKDVKEGDKEDDSTKSNEPVVVTNTPIDDSDNSSSPIKVELGVSDDNNDNNEKDDDEKENKKESTNINTQTDRYVSVGLQDPLIEINKKRVKSLSSLYYLVGTFRSELTDNGDESKIGFPVAFLLNARNEDNPDREGLVPMLSKLSDDFVEIINKKNNDSVSKEIILNIIRSNIPNFSDGESNLQRIINEYLNGKSDNQDINKVYEEDLKNNLYGFLDRIFIEQAADIHHNNNKSEKPENNRQAFLRNYESNIDKGRKFLQRVTVNNSKIQEEDNTVKELFDNVSSLIKVEDNNSRTFDNNAFGKSCEKLNNIYDIVATGSDENKTIVKDLEVKDPKELEFSENEQERQKQNKDILEAMNHAERVRRQFKRENDDSNGKIVDIIDNDKATAITKKDENGKETALKYPTDFSKEYMEVVKKTGNSIEVDLKQETVDANQLNNRGFNVEKIRKVYGQTKIFEIITINGVNFIIPSDACDWLEINKLIGKYRGVLAGMLKYIQKISLLRVGKELNKDLSCVISVGNGRSLDNGINNEETKILTKPGLTATAGKYKGGFLRSDEELLKKSLGDVYNSIKTDLLAKVASDLDNSRANNNSKQINV